MPLGVYAARAAPRAGRGRAPQRGRAARLLLGGQGAQALDLAQGGELAQRLDLDLADALARQAEFAADLVERARVAAVEAVAQLEHAAVALRQVVQPELQRLVAQAILDRVGGVDGLV